MPRSQNGLNTVPIRKHYRKRKKRNPAGKIFVVCVLLIAVLGGAIYLKKYGPTREKASLDAYYTYSHEDEAALIINDEYIGELQKAGDTQSGEAAGEESKETSEGSGEESAENGESEAAGEESEAGSEGEAGDSGTTEAGSEAESGEAIVRGGTLYIARDSLKSKIDDGYVFDDEEQVMRYATDQSLVSVPYGEASYTIDGNSQSGDYVIVFSEYEKVYVAADFANQYSDFTYQLFEEPYRAVLYTAGFEHDTAQLKKNTAIRRLGGPKSKVLKNAKKGEIVSVTKDYGNWSNVVSEDGVIGFIKNSSLGEVTKQKQEAVLPERTYNHKTMGRAFSLGWHIITFVDSNAGLSRVLGSEGTPDVMSPTWYRLSDSEGSISDISSSDYVKTCHDRGIQVWPVVSDFENEGVDDEAVLNRASHRDRLVKSLIKAASKSGIDGLNVDFEKVPIEAKDGFAQFIRELSLECELNDLFLSVDNYIPASYNLYYNRSVQNDYADYVVVMAYDEHHKGGGEAGSNASLPFVQQAVEGTLEEVVPERLVLGMPFFCREWIQEGDALSSMEYSLLQTSTYIKQHHLKPKWDEALGQKYAEYTEGDATHMIWIEDKKSLEKKLALINQYQLGGCAFWAMGFEPESIWSVVSGYMK